MEQAGGAIRIAAPSYQTYQTNIGTSDTAVTANLGFSVSSLDRVIAIFQRSAIVATSNSVDNRAKNDLVDFNLNIGNMKYPQISPKVEAGLYGGAEVLAESLISQRSLTSFGHTNSIQSAGGTAFNIDDGAGSSAATLGSFVLELDLQSQFSNQPMALVSGVNTIGSNVSMTFNFSAAPSTTQTISIYAEHTVLMSLDLASLTWNLAI